MHVTCLLLFLIIEIRSHYEYASQLPCAFLGKYVLIFFRPSLEIYKNKSLNMNNIILKLYMWVVLSSSSVILGIFILYLNL